MSENSNSDPALNKTVKKRRLNDSWMKLFDCNISTKKV